MATNAVKNTVDGLTVSKFEVDAAAAGAALAPHPALFGVGLDQPAGSHTGGGAGRRLATPPRTVG